MIMPIFKTISVSSLITKDSGFVDKEKYIETLKMYKLIDFDVCVSGHNINLGKEVIDEILAKMD